MYKVANCVSGLTPACYTELCIANKKLVTKANGMKSWGCIKTDVFL